MLGAAQTSHGITCPGSKSVQWGWDDARNEEQEVPWWREDLAQSWFSPFPLSLETKPLLELHPKIAFFLASRKPKNIEFGHEGVPGGFPDSLLLLTAFLGT